MPMSTRRVQSCRLAAPLLTSLLLLLPSSLQAQAPAQPNALDRLNQSIDALTKKVWPSVVQIMVTGYGARDEGGRGEVSAVVTRQRSVGSGFVIDPEGYILTNAHVVSGAQRVEILVPPANADGSLATALSARMTVVPARRH